MKFQVLYESERRLRIRVIQKRMSFAEADALLYYIKKIKGVDFARVSERTCNAVIRFSENKAVILRELVAFDAEKVSVPEELIKNSGRELGSRFQEKLTMKILGRFFGKFYLPTPIRIALTCFRAIKYIREGIGTLAKGKLEVAVLDAAAISVSLLKRDFKTAGSVMFLLGIGELLEEWTRKRAVGDLARTLSLNVNKVWIKKRRDGGSCQVRRGSARR